MLKLQFQDHSHNLRENWQVGNESIVQIDCQVIRQVVRTGESWQLLSTEQAVSQMSGWERRAAPCRPPWLLSAPDSLVGQGFGQQAASCSPRSASISCARQTTAKSRKTD